MQSENDLRAFEVPDGSMNRVFPAGSTLIYRRTGPHMPASGQLVVAMRRRRNRLEFVCREAVIADDGDVWLLAKTSDPEHWRPMRIDPASELPRIVGTVIARYQPEPDPLSGGQK